MFLTVFCGTLCPCFIRQSLISYTWGLINCADDRDDIFDIWTQGLPKLLEFTDYINSLYPTIKFELVHSHSFLHVLDLTLHLRDGFIITDIYAKPTDSHLYLPFYSSHPPHCKRAIPYGVALRIKRNCSTDEFLQNRQDEYKGYLKSQNCPGDLVDKQFQKALSIPRPELLTKKNKSDKKVFPLVLITIQFCLTSKKSSGSTSIYYTLHLILKKFSY